MRGRLTGRGASTVLLALALVLAACTPPSDPSPGGSALQPPGDLRATPGDGMVTLAWDGSSSDQVVRYNVYQGTSDDDLEKVGEAGSSARAHQVTGLANGTEYFFAIDAEDDEGRRSDRTAIARATPEEGLPSTAVCTFGETVFNACVLAP